MRPFPRRGLGGWGEGLPCEILFPFCLRPSCDLPHPQVSGPLEDSLSPPPSGPAHAFCARSGPRPPALPLSWWALRAALRPLVPRGLFLAPEERPGGPPGRTLYLHCHALFTPSRPTGFLACLPPARADPEEQAPRLEKAHSQYLLN